jgi:myo-inositol-1(or 4)-monophosphatase
VGLKAWDVAAGVLLVEEAGGAISRYDGSPHLVEGGEILAAAPGIQRAMIAALTSAR